MNIRRFTSTSTRQAMALVRAEFGNQAIILRTRSVEGGVEIVAMADEALAGTQPPPGRAAGREPATAGPRAGAAPRPEGSGVRAPAWSSSRQPLQPLSSQGRWGASDRLPARPGQLAHPPGHLRPGQALPSEPMSTLSFQQFVRDRLAHREQHGPAVPAPAELPQTGHHRAAEPSLSSSATGPATPDARPPSADHRSQASAQRAASPDQWSGIPAQVPAASQSAGGARTTAVASAAGRRVPRVIDPGASNETAHALMMPTAPIVPPDSDQSELLLAELRKMRGLMRSQLFSLARSGPDSVAQGLMRRLRGCGFSATLVRRLLEKIPADADNGRAEAWIRQLMVKVIRLDAPHRRILERGGIHALVGPTGVGKTTTVAKLAARFALRHGADAVGLVTLDTYRIGAHDQLRTFGRLLGIPVGVAHHAEGLANFMSENANRKLILIDTVGVGQRDQRLAELIDSTSSSAIRKLLVLNAAAHPETLEDVVKAYRVGSRGGIVVSKVDEAVKLGGVVDCLVRHRLPLIGLANGQRVPEDWTEPDVGNLVRQAFDTPASPVFDYDHIDADGESSAADHG